MIEGTQTDLFGNYRIILLRVSAEEGEHLRHVLLHRHEPRQPLVFDFLAEEADVELVAARYYAQASLLLGNCH